MHGKTLALSLLLPVIAFAAPPPGIPDGWSDGYVYANGVRLHYYHAVPAPGKPVMVMAHGVTDIGQPILMGYSMGAATVMRVGAEYPELAQAMYGTMRTGESLQEIQVPALILKADAPPETRQAHQEAASVMPNGKLVHIDGAGHNLHHDELARTVEVLNEFLSAL